ncbi:MAG: alpha/beta hydrolase [Lachnospiraceae bacterium]|nr:alpha/beta hydrolase [Lachnospiraceae bacterium]
MSKKEDIFYGSRDGRTRIHGVIWKPDCMTGDQPRSPRCVLQIVHGMEEHVERYDEFARFMNEYDICVIGEDHLGHGKSVKDEKDLGYFCAGDAATIVVRDVHRLKKIVQEQLPDVPFLILGHSMGSFIVRNYICRYGTGIAGAVIMGTGSKPKLVLGFGKFLTRLIGLFKGGHHKSALIQKIAFSGYGKRIKNPRSQNDWICANAETIKRYDADPLCGFGFTVNGFHTLFTFISRCQSPLYLKRIPKRLPLFFVAGEEDPVGDYGKGVRKAYDSYKTRGMLNLEMKLYKNDRHEILNESDKKTVSEDIYRWIDGVLRAKA